MRGSVPGDGRQDPGAQSLAHPRHWRTDQDQDPGPHNWRIDQDQGQYLAINAEKNSVLNKNG